MGAGWASRTWEKEIIEEGKKEIAELIGPEQTSVLSSKSRESSTATENRNFSRLPKQRDFDLYVEGVHFSWSTADLYKKIHAKLYQSLHSPLILVRTLRRIDQVSLLCLDPNGTKVLGALFDRIWKDCSVPLVLTHRLKARPQGAPHRFGKR